MPTTQLPFEELTRLCVCANLSSLDGSINLSIRPSPQNARDPHLSLPPGYQLNLETMATATGTTLVISLSQVNQGLEDQASRATVGTHRPRDHNLDVLDFGTTSAFDATTSAPLPENSMRQGLPMPDPHAWADYDGLDGIYPGMDGAHAHNLLDVSAMDRLLFCNDFGFTDAPQEPYTPSPSSQGDPAQQPPSPPSSSPSPSPPSSSNNSVCGPANSPPRKRKHAGGVKGRNFPCTMGCGEEFSRQHDRFRHEVLKHERSCRWVCDTCHKFFGSQKNLDRHVCNTKSRWVAPASKCFLSMFVI
ncbi:hypothetical protein K525DRAFT_189083 [Schizophyllum commune Loenen D]|nr:hypothetical protein K525DRAFT_189083 [Schizophyllum commune Loenen D]